MAGQGHQSAHNGGSFYRQLRGDGRAALSTGAGMRRNGQRSDWSSDDEELRSEGGKPQTPFRLLQAHSRQAAQNSGSTPGSLSGYHGQGSISGHHGQGPPGHHGQGPPGHHGQGPPGQIASRFSGGTPGAHHKESSCRPSMDWESRTSPTSALSLANALSPNSSRGSNISSMAKSGHAIMDKSGHAILRTWAGYESFESGGHDSVHPNPARHRSRAIDATPGGGGYNSSLKTCTYSGAAEALPKQPPATASMTSAMAGGAGGGVGGGGGSGGVGRHVNPESGRLRGNPLCTSQPSAPPTFASVPSIQNPCFVKANKAVTASQFSSKGPPTFGPAPPGSVAAGSTAPGDYQQRKRPAPPSPMSELVLWLLSWLAVIVLVASSSSVVSKFLLSSIPALFESEPLATAAPRSHGATAGHLASEPSATSSL